MIIAVIQVDGLREAIVGALLEPPGGGGVADFSPDRADEGVLADAILKVIQDRGCTFASFVEVDD